jgi:exopolyphosphatase / guanosine-5'-triphosphate,3'-diphosphate pyrophosphatase
MLTLAPKHRRQEFNMTYFYSYFCYPTFNSLTMRIAVLDLGTNTFNLLIAEKNGESGYTILHSSKRPVKLGEGGINRGEIIQPAFERGLNAILKHHQTIQQYKATKIYAFGTSALRTSKNGGLLLATIEEKTGIRVEIISGNHEAELIYYGVRQTHPMDQGKYLILDIGGGSNEFIIADNKQIYWKKSYKLGIARLLARFNPSDPISTEEIEKVKEYLEGEVHEIIEKAKEHKINTLIGASGSFETYVAMIEAADEITETQVALFPEAKPISDKDFNLLYEKLMRSTSADRAKMKGLEPIRIEMIVLACLFTKFIIEKLEIKTIIQSNFALKEGAVYQLINNP